MQKVVDIIGYPSCNLSNPYPATGWVTEAGDLNVDLTITKDGWFYTCDVNVFTQPPSPNEYENSTFINYTVAPTVTSPASRQLQSSMLILMVTPLTTMMVN
jgi:hypothetical protein